MSRFRNSCYNWLDFDGSFLLPHFRRLFALMLTKLLLLFLVSVLPVRVSTIDGEGVDGTFAGLSESSLRIQTTGTEVQIPVADLSSLEPQQEPQGTGPTMRLVLEAGTEIAAQALTLSGETFSVELRRQETVSIPIQLARSIRFRPGNPKVDPAWLAKIEEGRRSDTLAIRREGDRLDFIEGLVVSISADAVRIEIDGETMDAPISRLEGVIFGGAKGANHPGDIQIVDVYGSRWSASDLLPCEAEGPLEIQLQGSIQHRIPLDQVKSIRWTGGVEMLAGMTPAIRSHRESIETQIDKSLLEAWFAPAAVNSKADGSSESTQDLLMFGRSFIEYRIDEGFQTFSAGVRRDGSVERATQAIVRVWVDGKVAWEKRFEGDEVVGLELPLDQARRLRIEVDSGQDGDIGDTFRISRPRLLRS
ncbi:NPCBM/NEW2 domain-containing protein [Novipirellula artificiosorum]|uniref:NPCBM/NEW2 domain protein n=1 Tax=Novipirellula artificiosorum TaxID=2528016 RepID=A0A5C6D7L0_9BACT|nr:NPCBM/NEW2 domain-containing protein [Novipirellula artificiosorum]TWU32922.1 NPCBM/NEW2 domain protein [Novipirellula artificiosorum]